MIMISGIVAVAVYGPSKVFLKPVAMTMFVYHARMFFENVQNDGYVGRRRLGGPEQHRKAQHHSYALSRRLEDCLSQLHLAILLGRLRAILSYPPREDSSNLCHIPIAMQPIPASSPG